MILLAAIPVLVWDFTTSNGSWVSGGSPTQWMWGPVVAGPVELDVGWGTQLGGLTLHEATSTLTSPVLDTSAMTSPTLAVDHWHDLGDGDLGVFEADVGAGWTSLEPVFGYVGGDGLRGATGTFESIAIPLPVAPVVAVRLKLVTDDAGAGLGWYVRGASLVDGDAAAPLLEPILLPVDTQDVAGPYVFEVSAVDDVATSGVDLIVGGERTAFVDQGGDLWRAELPAVPPGTRIDYLIEATDGANVATWPTLGTGSFRVYLAAPTDLAAAEPGRQIGAAVPLCWTAPVTPETVLTTQWLVDGVIVGEGPGTCASVPVDATGTREFRVRGRFDAGVGDVSEPLLLDVELASIGSVEPAEAYAGDAVRVTVTGLGLYLDAASSISFGDGIDVVETEVVDAMTLRATLNVSSDAEVGEREVVVDTPYGEVVGAFDVRDGAERPHILSVTPGSLVQGDEATLTVLASAPWADDIATFDDGEVVVVAPPKVDGTTLTVRVAVASRAAVGTHDLVLDDGLRLWTASVYVEEWVAPPAKNCAHGGGAPWLAVLALAWRRQRARKADIASAT